MPKKYYKTQDGVTQAIDRSKPYPPDRMPYGLEAELEAAFKFWADKL